MTIILVLSRIMEELMNVNIMNKNSAKLIFQLFNDGNNLFTNNNICLNII